MTFIGYPIRKQDHVANLIRAGGALELIGNQVGTVLLRVAEDLIPREAQAGTQCDASADALQGRFSLALA